MKPFFHHFVALVLLICGICSAGLVRGYDVPNFDYEVFHADGIFLEESERQSLLEALAAVASNFPETGRIDSDLREKALAIALRIHPLHRNSRNAHEMLTQGRLPAKTEYFDSISSVSEALWSAGQHLLREPVDPEEKKLASLILELSLLMHPEPPLKRMKQFAVAFDPEVNDWNRIITVQRDENPSSVKSANLAHEVADLIEAMKSAPPPAMTEVPEQEDDAPVNGRAGKAGKAGAEKGSPAKADRSNVFRAQSRSLSSVRTVTAVESSAVAGLFRVELRTVSGAAENDLFPFVKSDDVSSYPQIPILSSLRAVPVSEVVLPVSVAQGRGWEWTPGTLAEIGFEPDEGAELPGPRRISNTTGVLPALVLLDSIFRDKEINPDVVIAGELDVETMFPAMSGGILETIDAATSIGKPYLLLPSNVVPDLVAELQLSGELDKLFSLELISYATLEEAVSLCTSGVDAKLKSAIDAFAEVKAVSNKMPLIQFAQNPSVQERLQAIVEASPNHLSSRAMLEFGRTPMSEEHKILQSVRSIDPWLEPYLSLDDPPDLTALRERFEEDEYGLSRLRTEIHPDVRDYYGKVEDLFEAAEKYITLTNFDTSTAQQRLRDFEALVVEVEDQRSQFLGEKE